MHIKYILNKLYTVQTYKFCAHVFTKLKVYVYVDLQANTDKHGKITYLLLTFNSQEINVYEKFKEIHVCI